MEQPAEKKVDYADLLCGVFLGIFIGWLAGDGLNSTLTMSAAGLEMVVSAVILYALCRWATPHEWFLGSCAGLVIMGFWQIWTNNACGPHGVAVGLGAVIGAMLARYVSAKKSSPA